jgi:hypothetical protein
MSKIENPPAFPHRRLTKEEAERAGYKVLHLRKDDGRVQSMEAVTGYRVTYGAPSYARVVAEADAMLTARGPQ